MCCGERYVGCLQFECVPIYVSVCFVRFIIGELFVECLCSLCGEVNVFSLKVMVLFLGCVGFLLASSCIVFQTVCELCL